MSEAHQTLMDPARRERYMQLLEQGGGTVQAQRAIASTVEAATNFQKAEICLRRNDYAQAEELCAAAHAADPDQPDYLALLAWLVSMKPEQQSPEATLACVKKLDEALKLNEKCEKAHFYRAMLHKKLGNMNAAYRDFRRASDLNPRNIDAAREVRLFRMRAATTSSKPPPRQSVAPTSATRAGVKSDAAPRQSGGLLGKLFKKP
jgi:Tfp pilus assembly protein PilF